MGIRWSERTGRFVGLAAALLAGSGACHGGGDEGSDEMTAPDEDRRLCDEAIDEVNHSCFAPNGVSIVEDSDRLSVIDIATSAMALEGGFYFPRQDGPETADNVGFVLADNEMCQVACLVQCNLATQSLCITSLAQDSAADPGGCFFCGEFTDDECQTFISSCQP